MKHNKFFAPLFGLALAATLVVPWQSASAQTAEEEQQQATDNRITLEVDNENWLDVRVYVVSGALVRRIGTVTSFTTREFTLPRYLNSAGNNLQIVLSPIGSRGVHYSIPLLVNPGGHIQYRIANNLSLSHVQTVT